MNFVRTPSIAIASTAIATAPTASHAPGAPGEPRVPPRLVVHRATRWFDRLRGLLGSPPPAPGHALLIVPCASIHTAFMRYPIDVVFLDRLGRIRKVVAALPPWRATACLGAAQTLELAAGQARALALVPGGRIDPSILSPQPEPTP